ncbi:MAG: hypothetical protein ACOYJJ_07425 [Anaerovoracaceae bacterium]
MKEKIQNLYSAVRPYLSVSGKNTTSVPYIDAYRCDQKEIVLPDTADPYIFLIINGSMQLRYLEGIYHYDPGQYFISAIDSPRSWAGT